MNRLVAQQLVSSPKGSDRHPPASVSYRRGLRVDGLGHRSAPRRRARPQGSVPLRSTGECPAAGTGPGCWPLAPGAWGRPVSALAGRVDEEASFAVPDSGDALLTACPHCIPPPF